MISTSSNAVSPAFPLSPSSSGTVVLDVDDELDVVVSISGTNSVVSDESNVVDVVARVVVTARVVVVGRVVVVVVGRAVVAVDGGAAVVGASSVVEVWASDGALAVNQRTATRTAQRRSAAPQPPWSYSPMRCASSSR